MRSAIQGINKAGGEQASKRDSMLLTKGTEKSGIHIPLALYVFQYDSVYVS